MQDENEPCWPPERDIERYSELLGFAPRDQLCAGAVWLDLGCRSGQALDGAASTGARLVGVNDRSIGTVQSVESRVATLPGEHEALADLRGACRLVTDIYGAFAYAADPVEVLAHELALLAPDGCFTAVFLPSKFQDPEDLGDLQRGVESLWGFTSKATTFENRADINGRNIQVTRLHVRALASTTFQPEAALARFREVYGKPAVVGIAWRSADGAAVQHSVAFQTRQRSAGPSRPAS